MESKLSKFLSSEASEFLESKIIHSLEAAKLSILRWLDENNFLQHLKKIEIDKINIDYIAVQYSLDLVFFDENIDDFKGNWIGCFINFYSHNDDIEVAFIVHSIYEEKNYLNFTLKDNLPDELYKHLNELSGPMIKCLFDYFMKMDL